MNAARAFGLLRTLGTPAFTTSDAAARLGQSVSVATRMLRRLQAEGLVRSIRRGLWSTQESLDPMVLAEYLTAPHPAYVSLQSALRFHGMIEQIPSMTYVASLMRSHRMRTSVGTFSIHRVAPAFFGGFELTGRTGAKVATPEKALLDVFYLAGVRSRLFASLPEVELPKTFRLDQARSWIRKIPSARLRTMVARRLEAVVTASKTVRPRPRAGT